VAVEAKTVCVLPFSTVLNLVCTHLTGLLERNLHIEELYLQRAIATQEDCRYTLIVLVRYKPTNTELEAP
jgi:hypothetical protein